MKCVLLVIFLLRTVYVLCAIPLIYSSRRHESKASGNADLKFGERA